MHPRILVDGNRLARKLLAEVSETIQREQHAHPAFYAAHPEWRSPRLDILNVGLEDGSLSYIRKKIELASSLSIRFRLHQFLERTDSEPHRIF